ncbi:MAG: FAD:protein FMN transferase [Tissierellia bacterium]|nr:FAD:protein FMN transferase [Tissierellia bacterium]
MKRLITLVLSLSLILTSCSGLNKAENDKPEERKKFEHTFFDTFDTIIKYVEYDESEEEFNENKKFVEDEFRRLHKIYDNYKSYDGINNVKTINENAGKGPIEVDEDLIDLIRFSIDCYKNISDKTNIAMGSVLEIWSDYREEGIEDPDKAKIPSHNELSAAKEHMDIDKIKIDKKKKTVELEDPEMRLDLGATAKGYATELIAQKLIEKGVDSAIISAGGNVRTIGRPKDGMRDEWGIGIQNPDNILGKSELTVADVLYVHDTSVVTSGDYQRFYTVDGKNYHHIIDPEQLMPMTYFRSVSVVTEDSGVADFLSTAAFLLPFEESKKLIESYKGAEAMWIMSDDSIEATDNLLKMMKSNGATSKDE